MNGKERKVLFVKSLDSKLLDLQQEYSFVFAYPLNFHKERFEFFEKANKLLKTEGVGK